MFESLKNKRILVVVAHPDDEILGPGAAMHRLIARNGCRIRVVILGEGITARSEKRHPEKFQKELDKHRANVVEAAKRIGYHETRIHDFPDNRFDTVPLLDIVKTVESEKNEFDPETIFTHHGGDLNIDHRRTLQAVSTATRPLEGEKVRAIFSFETPSSTEWQIAQAPMAFIPNVFIPVSREDLDAKIDAMECYEMEKRPYPHPRSPEGLEILAKRWGVAIGAPYAEAFALVRYIL